MIILSEASSQLEPSVSRADIRRSTEAAKLIGLPVYAIPPDFSVAGSAENALWHVPPQESEETGFWIGYIPEPERYQAMYDAALRKRIRLVNAPAQHQRAMEFHRYYPLLGDLTPRSMTLTAPDECSKIEQELGYPTFIRGTIQSRKHDGWFVCVAHDHDEALVRVSDLLRRATRSRGYVIVRELVRLRNVRQIGKGFPAGREYRAFVLHGAVVALGYYWEDPDELSRLTSGEEQTVRALAAEASRRVDVPYLAVDLGQLDDGEWVVIEVGDAQFTGLSQVSPLKLWSGIREIASNQE